MRYTDDQIVMTRNADDTRLVVFNASKELHEIGLNVNSGKVVEFSSRDDYEYYWPFSPFDLLEDKENVSSVN